MPEKKPAPFPLRLNPDLKATLERLAKADGRSLNSYIVHVLSQHVPPKPKKG